MQSILLKLHAAKIMHVGRVALHLLQHKLDICLRDYVLFIYVYDARSLPKFSSATAPTRPNAQPHVINRQRWRRDHTEHAHQCLHPIDFAADVLAKNIVGIERKKENSSAAGRDMPAISPAAMVDIEREVPGKTAERICAAPIQTACGRVISSMCVVRDRRKTASTIHMMIPPMRSARAITQRFSRFLPICFARAHAGTAVTTNAINVRLNGCVKIVRLPRSPFGKVETNCTMRCQK